MNLHRLVRGSINAINHDHQIVWFASQGSILAPGGIATPSYAPAQPIWAQIQPVPTDELAHLDQLNIQGVLRQVYIKGAMASVVRADDVGGDLLQFPERWTAAAITQMNAWTASGAGLSYVPPLIRTWLVMQIPEQWDCWCKAIVRLQNDLNTAITSDSSVPADAPVSADA